MEARKKRNIKNGTEYDSLFPRSENDNKTIRKNANVYHTVSFIPKVVQQTLEQTKGIAKRINGKSLYETCSNIWHFVYQHINYKKDEEGYEQIRSPARAWHDRQQGVDCDCYSVFISSVLTNLGIPHILRITKYHRDYFQHIYPIVQNGSKNITIDCVTDKFDYEVPYSEKKDYPMDLQYLNGFDGDGMEELGKLIKKNITKSKTSPVKTITTPKLSKKVMKKVAKSNPATPAPAGSSVPVANKKKGILKKVLNTVNKVNPATVLLRNGVLAAMKLNVKNVAGRLRWSYLTPEQAVAKNIDPDKFQKLIATRQKLENIFYGAGGKPDNLRKAILAGKGNKDKAVSGLGILPMMEAAYMNEHITLEQLLSPEIYYSENVEGMDGFRGFGELGEPVTLATVGAAMGVIAGIVAALKQIGNIFKTKEKGSEDFDETKTDAPENNIKVPANSSTTAIPDVATNPIIPVTDDGTTSQNFNPAATSETSSMNTSNAMVKTTENPLPANLNKEAVTTNENTEEKTSNTNTSDNNPSGKESFWDKNKKWLKPVAIGLGGLTIIAIGYKLSQGSKTQNKSSPKQHSLSGTPRKSKKKKHYQKSNHQHKKAVILL